MLTIKTRSKYGLNQSSKFSLAAIRLVGALQYVGYSKLLRLASPSEAALGQLVTFVTGDQERIVEVCVMGPHVMATPVMFIISLVYTIYITGPSSLVGFLVLIVFYPVMVITNLGMSF